MDANGTPLGLRLTGANCNDSRMLAATLDAVPGCALAGVAARGVDPTSCTPTRATIIAVVEVSAGPAASHHGSLDGALRAASTSAAIAGSWSAPWLGWPASAD
ncbi:hypothetical protein GCM10007890_22550 [Methylobacterium tardum]|uniref:Uncharacterized protein n=1 Tax=Methylobacterium tardum TaxID=374432 RepID=A0AA37WSG7_9HYPH|nr:hypothetical protein GCM10007890_22550 [Methylobacterium tardum]